MRVSAGVLMALLLLAGCAANGRDSGAGAPALLPSVKVTLLGDSVRFLLQVTNTTAQPVELEYPTGQGYDFVVRRGGEEVWRWSAERMFTQALRTERLAPGGTLSYDAVWSPPAGAEGEYEVAGLLTARSHAVEQRARFRLP